MNQWRHEDVEPFPGTFKLYPLHLLAQMLEQSGQAAEERKHDLWEDS